MAAFRGLMELPRSSGCREQLWNPESRASALTKTAIGRMRARSRRTCDLREGVLRTTCHDVLLATWRHEIQESAIAHRPRVRTVPQNHEISCRLTPGSYEF